MSNHTLLLLQREICLCVALLEFERELKLSNNDQIKGLVKAAFQLQSFHSMPSPKYAEVKYHAMSTTETFMA